MVRTFHFYMSLVMRKPAFCIYAKTKMQISCAVTAQLISAFVFAIRILQSLYYINLKFQASGHLLWLYSPVCVGPGPKSRRPAHIITLEYLASNASTEPYTFFQAVNPNFFTLITSSKSAIISLRTLRHSIP